MIFFWLLLAIAFLAAAFGSAWPIAFGVCVVIIAFQEVKKAKDTKASHLSYEASPAFKASEIANARTAAEKARRDRLRSGSISACPCLRCQSFKRDISELLERRDRYHHYASEASLPSREETVEAFNIMADQSISWAASRVSLHKKLINAGQETGPAKAAWLRDLQVKIEELDHLLLPIPNVGKDTVLAAEEAMYARRVALGQGSEVADIPGTIVLAQSNLAESAAESLDIIEVWAQLDSESRILQEWIESTKP